MLSEENSELYEATCVDCGTTKSYFTAQGVGYFKLNHEGHKVVVKQPAREGSEKKEEPKVELAPMAESEPEPEVESVPEPVRVVVPQVRGRQAVVEAPREGPIRLGNLVVDVVDEEKGRAIKIFGIAGGLERFTKEFGMNQVDELNAFLESGSYPDGSNATYTWSPDKIDISMDVVKMLEEPRTVPEEPKPVPALAPVVAEPAPEVKVEMQEVVTAPPQVVRTVEQVPAQAPTEEILLGKLSYIQPGDDYRQESIRISKVLRKYRWNTEPPYVIGAMFDDLMSIQSQTGMIKASAIDAMTELGYDFVAIEAPSGAVTAWFRKRGEGEAHRKDEPLEFDPKAPA